MKKHKEVMAIIRKYVGSFDVKTNNMGMAYHPFFRMPMTLDANGEMVFVTEQNLQEVSEPRFEKIEELLKDQKPHEAFILMIDKAYHLPLFGLINEYLSQREYDKLLINSWVNTEFPHENDVDFLIGLFDKSKNLMSKKELKTFNELPNPVKIYRGLQRGAIDEGLAWTVNLEKAKWFANRFDNDMPTILTAEIDKEYIFAYTDSRKEKEIILNPNHLNNIKVL